MAINARRRLGFTLRRQVSPKLATRFSKKSGNGFTLVELLVVITIIGMLVALLLPAVHSVRERARQTQCMNNLKQLSLAVVSYDSSKGQIPGLTQFVKRQSTGNQTNYADAFYDPAARKFSVKTTGVTNAATLNKVAGLSWATMLLSRLERGDIWDSIVQPPDPAVAVPMPGIDVFVCPSDTDVKSQPDVAGLSYSANSGTWDRDVTGTSGNFLYMNGKGDTVDNGVFFELADYARQAGSPQGPTSRISAIKDGAGTTLMLAENIHKSYYSSTNAPLFSWIAGSESLDPTNYPSEQQLGFVWVVPKSGTAPSPGNTINDQERIGGDTLQTGLYDPTMPRFARPASSHGSGANAAYCDGHSSYLRDDIDYIVYVQLMTPNGRKCVDPTDHSIATGAIKSYRTAPPLAQKDFE
jgi:prepilin-type N-terminal cleavage/methylation domain-containing protein/prepilin-type processing-associated H-X9-DG protein